MIPPLIMVSSCGELYWAAMLFFIGMLERELYQMLLMRTVINYTLQLSCSKMLDELNQHNEEKFVS